MAHAGGKTLTDWHVSNVFSIHSDSAALQWLQAGKSINKFGLAISVDSGDTDDLTSVNLKGNAVDCVILMMLGSNHHILDIQNNFTGLCFFFLYNEVYVSSNHHGRKLLRVGISDVYSSDAFSLTKNGTAVCNLHDLTKLVGNEQNAFTLGCQIFHDLHKLLDFLRSKYCGRLIKDQDLVVTVKHFQDLGSLLHTYCGILDNGIRIYRKTIFFGKGHNLFTRALFLKETVFCGLNTKDNIIQNTEAFYQFEMLMYHSNAQVICIVWIFDFNFLSIFVDLALFRLIQTKQNAHQSGFTCSIFAKQSVDLTFF